MGREPWLAANLSLFLPGLGQICLGRRSAGMVLLALYLGFAGLAVALFILPEGSMRAGAGCLLLGLAVEVASLVHAHRVAAAGNPPEFEATRRATRDPWLAVFLTRLLPGLGHIYLSARTSEERVFVRAISTGHGARSTSSAETEPSRALANPR